MSPEERSAASRHYNRAKREGQAGFRASHPFSNATIRNLCRTDFLILHELTFLTRVRRKNHPDKAPYVHPGQRYLADKCGVSREWISRRTSQLHKLGIINKTWRRPKANGEYQSCIYWVTERCRWLMGRLINALSSWPNRVNNTARKPTSSSTYNGGISHFLPSSIGPPG
jgi:hypothetical protein